MPRIIATTREPVYNAQGQLTGHLTHTDSVEETATSSRRLHTQAAPTCTHCHEAQTACHCLTPQPHTQAQESVEDWLPLSIMSIRAGSGPRRRGHPDDVKSWLPLSILTKREP